VYTENTCTITFIFSKFTVHSKFRLVNINLVTLVLFCVQSNYGVRSKYVCTENRNTGTLKIQEHSKYKLNCVQSKNVHSQSVVSTENIRSVYILLGKKGRGLVNTIFLTLPFFFITLFFLRSKTKLNSCGQLSCLTC